MSDGLANDSITLNLTINPVDDPAVIFGDLNKTIQEDSTASGTIIASDIDGLSDGSLLYSSSPGNGNASIDQSGGNWTYVPHPNFFGDDNFTISITDDLNQSSFEIIHIFIHPIDDPAHINGDFNKAIQEDSLAFGDLNATDLDGLSDGSYFAISTPPVHGISAIDPVDGNWTYIPHHHFFGDDFYHR